MPNIFDGIEKLSTEDLRNQIATLEEMTMKNVIGQMGNKIGNKAARAFSFMRKTVTGKETQVAEPETVESKIEKKRKELYTCSRYILESRLRTDLTAKVNSATFQNLENPSDDLLSAEVIDLAVKNFKKDKISDDLTYAQKADMIRHRYDERMLTQMQEQLSKQTEEEKRKTEQAIQKELDSMPEERREELRKALNIEKINGEMVRKTFATTAGVSATVVVMESAGFGAYIALTTIMHAIFTTLLGITLPFAAYTGATTVLSAFTGPVGFLIVGGIEAIMLNSNKNKIIYELAAQTVWLAVTAYGHKFTPNEEELPSWLPSLERDREVAEINELHSMIKEDDNLKEIIDRQKRELENAKDIIKRNETEIATNQQESEAARKKIERLQEECQQLKKESVNSENLQATLAEKDREISQLYDELEQDANRIDALEKRNSEARTSIAEKDEEISRLEEKIEESKRATEKKWAKNADELQGRWVKFFKTIDFEHTVFKEVIKDFEFNDLGSIEIKLREIDDAKDKRAVRGNRGMVGDRICHVAFSSPSGFPCRIFYKELKDSPKGKAAIITAIVKHNDPRYESLCN